MRHLALVPLLLAGELPAVEATPTPVRVVTPSAGTKTSFGGQFKLKKSPEEARRLLEGASGSATKAPAESLPERESVEARRARRGARSAAEPAEPLDLDGHGEAWWRSRMQQARDAAAREKAGYEAAEAAAGGYERSFPSWGSPAQQSSFGAELQRLRNDRDMRKVRAEDAQRRVLEIEEEARRKGALPGWLR